MAAMGSDGADGRSRKKIRLCLCLCLLVGEIPQGRTTQAAMAGEHGGDGDRIDQSLGASKNLHR